MLDSEVNAVPTLESFQDRFGDYSEANNKPSTVYGKRWVLRLHLVPAFGRRRLDAIGPADVEAYKARKLRTAAVAFAIHSMATRADGSLGAWGFNADGQLGDGTTTNRSGAVSVGGGFTVVAVGTRHSLGVLADGTLWAWGYNTVGQLGDGTTPARATPARIDVNP
jgi:hypothetical protein